MDKGVGGVRVKCADVVRIGSSFTLRGELGADIGSSEDAGSKAVASGCPGMSSRIVAGIMSCFPFPPLPLMVGFKLGNPLLSVFTSCCCARW